MSSPVNNFSSSENSSDHSAIPCGGGKETRNGSTALDLTWPQFPHTAITIRCITGRRIQAYVAPHVQIQSVKGELAKRLRLQEGQIDLTYNYRILVQGTMLENNITNGAEILVVPKLQTKGLLSGRDNFDDSKMNRKKASLLTISQALENITEEQATNFLLGIIPLILFVSDARGHHNFLKIQLTKLALHTCSTTLHNSSSLSSLNEVQKINNQEDIIKNKYGAFIQEMKDIGAYNFSGTMLTKSLEKKGNKKVALVSIILEQLLNASSADGEMTSTTGNNSCDAESSPNPGVILNSVRDKQDITLTASQREMKEKVRRLKACMVQKRALRK